MGHSPHLPRNELEAGGHRRVGVGLWQGRALGLGTSLLAGAQLLLGPGSWWASNPEVGAFAIKVNVPGASLPESNTLYLLASPIPSSATVPHLLPAPRALWVGEAFAYCQEDFPNHCGDNRGQSRKKKKNSLRVRKFLSAIRVSHPTAQSWGPKPDFFLCLNLECLYLYLRGDVGTSMGSV